MPVGDLKYSETDMFVGDVGPYCNVFGFTGDSAVKICAHWRSKRCFSCLVADYIPFIDCDGECPRCKSELCPCWQEDVLCEPRFVIQYIRRGPNKGRTEFIRR